MPKAGRLALEEPDRAPRPKEGSSERLVNGLYRRAAIGKGHVDTARLPLLRLC